MAKRPSQIAQSFTEDIINDPTYRSNLRTRAQAGILSPVVEKMLWEYAFGKPQENINLTINETLQGKSTEELLAMLQSIDQELERIDAEQPAVH